MSSIAFGVLQGSCKHQGYIRGEVPMCSFKDGHNAKCWDDWQECNKNNCFLLSKKKIEGPENQQSIFDIIGG